MFNGSIKIFERIMYGVIVVTLGIILYANPSDKVGLLGAMSIAFISVHLVESILLKKGSSNKGYMIIGGLKLFIALSIPAVDTTGLSVILILNLIGEWILKGSLKRSLAYTFTVYILYCISLSIGHGVLSQEDMAIVILNFFIVYILVFSLKHQTHESQRAKLVAKELEIKTRELEQAYKKLQELYEEKEEVILLKERNRIAGEIHDTVGHILTTVIIQLEASKRLMKKDSNLALEKLDLAQQEVRKGLNDIRHSVRALKQGEPLMAFVDTLKVFIEEVEKNSEVVIHLSCNEVPVLNRQIQNIIYRALQEGITNGIRHGESKCFIIILACHEAQLELHIEDEGKGAKDIALGFGLYNMKRKIEEVGGRFQISSAISKGTKLSIYLPIEGGDSDD